MHALLLVVALTTPCRTGTLPFPNGLTFTVPAGYCARVDQGEVVDRATAARVLTFSVGSAAPPGILDQRNRATKGSRESVWFVRGRETEPLFTFHYRALPPKVAASMDQLIDSVAARAKQPMFKGMELYSWKRGDGWTFALLPGTNRLKSDAEVLATPIASVSDLESKLATLAAGEWLSWNVPDHAPFAVPPPDVVADIESFCNLAGIRLQR